MFAQFANSSCSPDAASHLLYIDGPGTATDFFEGEGPRKELPYGSPPAPKRPRLPVSQDALAEDGYGNDCESTLKLRVSDFPSRDFVQSLPPLVTTMPTLIDTSRPLRLSSGLLGDPPCAFHRGEITREISPIFDQMLGKIREYDKERSNFSANSMVDREDSMGQDLVFEREAWERPSILRGWSGPPDYLLHISHTPAG